MPDQQLDIFLEEEFDDILVYARQKFRDGAKKHGVFNPSDDAETDRIYEAENELVDNINYSLMQITKLRRLGKRINFEDLPEDCRRLVLSDYKEIWEIE